MSQTQVLSVASALSSLFGTSNAYGSYLVTLTSSLASTSNHLGGAVVAASNATIFRNSGSNIYSVGSNLALNATATASTLGVAGNAAVGAAFLNAPAPANGLIVQGAVGVGRSNVTAGYALEVAGTLGAASLIATSNLVVGGTQVIDAARNLSNVGSIAASGPVQVGGNLAVLGDLTVTGTTTTINTSNLSISDNVVVLNSQLTGSNVPAALVSGIEVNRGSAAGGAKMLVWQEQTSLFKMGSSNALQALVARSDNLSNGYPYYDAAQAQLVTRTITTADVAPGAGLFGATASAPILFASNAVAPAAASNAQLASNLAALSNATIFRNSGSNIYSVGSNLALNATATSSTLGVAGNAAVGAAFQGAAAPANGLIVQGALGVGRSNVTAGYALEVAGTLGAASLIATSNLVVGGTQVIDASRNMSNVGSIATLGPVQVGGGLAVLGDLTVTGTTTTINTSNLSISDSLVVLNSQFAGSSVPAALVGGIEVSRGTAAGGSKLLVWQEQTGLFKMGSSNDLPGPCPLTRVGGAWTQRPHGVRVAGADHPRITPLATAALVKARTK